jgi:hypothetical protein
MNRSDSLAGIRRLTLFTRMGPTRRSRTPLRAAIIATLLLLPALTLLVRGAASFLPIAALPGVLLLPPLIMKRRQPPPGPKDSDDGGGNGGSRTPQHPKGLPGGGLPMPDAQPSDRRYRGTPRTTLIPTRQRRPAREPIRPRVPERVY